MAKVSLPVSEYFRTLQRKSVRAMTPARLAHLKRIAKLPKPRKTPVQS